MADENVRNPRLVVPGDKIIPKGHRIPDVVRSVAVIVRMASGMDYVYEDEDEVRIAPEGAVAPSEEEVLEAHRRAVEQIEAETAAVRARTAEIIAAREELEQARLAQQEAISESQDRKEGE